MTQQPDSVPLLEVSGLSKHYGGVAALADAHLVLHAGEVHVLIGANGSGKSTLCKSIAGAVAPDSGNMSRAGVPVRFSDPAQAARAGIGVFYQELSLIPQLTVAQNIFLDREPRTRSGLVDERAMRAAAANLMRHFASVGGHNFAADSIVADLAPDQRQITEILKVLSRDTEIILFDEATAALDRRQVEVFFDLIRDLRERGRAIVFISHRMDEIFDIGDRITVLRNGRTVAALAVSETRHEEVVTHMVGEHGRAQGDSADEQVATHAAQVSAEPVLSVSGLQSQRLDNVSLTVHGGEIVGLGGLHGQGQSALLRSLFGATRSSGTVELAQKRFKPVSPQRALRAGFAYVSGDRGEDGILPTRSVFENLAMARLSQSGSLLVRPRRLRARLQQALTRLQVKFSGLGAPVTSLSGGNQQKVVIGRWLATAPRILLLDDPTKGIDLQARDDLYRMLHELTAQGVAIVFNSSDDVELLQVSDRVLVFNAGRIVTELRGDKLTRFELTSAAYGGAA